MAMLGSTLYTYSQYRNKCILEHGAVVAHLVELMLSLDAALTVLASYVGPSALDAHKSYAGYRMYLVEID